MKTRIFGILRVKNEERWIERAVGSIRPICEEILVLDDHSTDQTADLAWKAGAELIASPFSGLDEARDKNHLLKELYRSYGPFGAGDWALMIDGDEEMTGAAALPGQLQELVAYALRILFLWDSPQQIRLDGVYRNFWRPSVFPLTPGRQLFTTTQAGGNFHCSSVPRAFWSRRPLRIDSAALLHYGYLDQADRLRKFHWYNARDPGNAGEDYYRHMVQGDLPGIPAEAKLRHGGPLELGALCDNFA